jgi:glutamate carboxypeptidase
MLNVVPDLVQACFDLRFLHPEDRIATEMRWHEMLHQHYIMGTELTLTLESDFKDPMVCTPQTLMIVRQAQEIAAMLGFSLNHTLTGGSSDASYTTRFGIPTLDGLGPIGGLDHSPDEYLLLSSIGSRTALLAGLIETVGIEQ